MMGISIEWHIHNQILLQHMQHSKRERMVSPWGSHISLVMSFFAWEVWCGRIMTLDNLKSRGIQLVAVT